MKQKSFLILLFFSIALAKGFAQQNAFIQRHSTERDTIYIASEPDYPPYCIVDEKGEAAGFSIDLFKAAAEAANLKVEIKIGVWNKIKQDLAEGKIDALPLVGRTPEREEFYDFTMPYLSLHGAIFVRKGTSDIHDLSDLKEKEIIVMKGDNAEEFVRREQLSERIITTSTFDEAFKLLASGRHDAVITQRVMGLNLLEKLKIKSIEPLDIQIPSFRQDFCFAVKKGDTALLARLNEGLSVIIANDTYEEIRFKWFGPILTEKMSFRDFFRLSVIYFLPIFFLFAILAIFWLRREVLRRTKKLKDEIRNHEKTLAALQISEEKYHGMIMNLMEGFYSVTLDGILLEYNREFAEILKLDISKKLKGINLPDFWQNPQDRTVYVKEILKNKFIKNFEINAKKANGEQIIILANSRLVCDKQGKPLRIEGSFLDITERKKTEHELMQMKDDLEKLVEKRTAELREKVEKLDKSEKAMLYMVEDLNFMTKELQEERRKLLLSNQELEAFTYSVSHDLRAPLRAIDGFGKFLLEDYCHLLDDEGKRFINIIRQNSCKMDQLISDLLNLSRISKLDLNFLLTDMKNIAESMFHEIASAKEKIDFQLIIDEIPQAYCDVILLKLVWQNLISNAIKYSSKAAMKRIEIKAFQKDSDVVYSIKDYGVGFNEKYIDKLFGVFQRLHKEEEFEGTGVGLAIVKRIIFRHGGKVWAEGKVNKGAVFYFSLPKRKGKSE
jgi:PAS domain S-box-containing protein